MAFTYVTVKQFLTIDFHTVVHAIHLRQKPSIMQTRDPFVDRPRHICRSQTNGVVGALSPKIKPPNNYYYFPAL
jgi:hypothetical protein